MRYPRRGCVKPACPYFRKCSRCSGRVQMSIFQIACCERVDWLNWARIPTCMTRIPASGSDIQESPMDNRPLWVSCRDTNVELINRGPRTNSVTMSWTTGPRFSIRRCSRGRECTAGKNLDQSCSMHFKELLPASQPMQCAVRSRQTARFTGFHQINSGDSTSSPDRQKNRVLAST